MDENLASKERKSEWCIVFKDDDADAYRGVATTAPPSKEMNDHLSKFHE